PGSLGSPGPGALARGPGHREHVAESGYRGRDVVVPRREQAASAEVAERPDCQSAVAQPRVQTSSRFFAGIEWSPTNTRPQDLPSATSARSSRTPMFGSCAFRAASNARFDSLVNSPLRLTGPYRQNTPFGRSALPTPANVSSTSGQLMMCAVL